MASSSFAQTTHTYSDAPATFPPIDGTTPCAAPLSRTINVTDSYTVTDVNVGVLINHEWRDDVQITLESPSGTRVIFVTGAGDEADHINVQFDDDATDSYTANTTDPHTLTAPPYQFDNSPQASLSAFDGENVNGDWILEVCDTFPTQDDGNFRRADLYITDTAAGGGPTMDGVEDLIFPSNYWQASYYEGRDGTPGSTSWGSSSDGTGSAGTKTYHGEAYFGYNTNSVLIASNGSASFDRWSNTETPTSPNLHSPTYVGTSWTGSNPHYQIDLRRESPVTGQLTFGFGANEVVDDIIDVYVNGVRQYAYFPSGGAPDPRPGQGVGVTIPVNAGDEVLARFINLGFIGGFTFLYEFTATVPSVDLVASKDVQLANTAEYAIPGNDVIYTLNVRNQGSGGTDTDTLFLVDSLPSEIAFYNGDYNGASPGTDVIGFAQTGSSLTFTEASDLAYSNLTAKPANFANCIYTPTAGYDENVRHICFNPKGVLAAGSPDPEFDLSFRGKIK